jgi:hypothetical protein
MAVEFQNTLAAGIIQLALAGFIGSMSIWILDKITHPDYVPKKERLRRAALLESTQNKKHGNPGNKKRNKNR